MAAAGAREPRIAELQALQGKKEAVRGAESRPDSRPLGFRVQGSGFRVQGSGFRVQGSGFGVQGSGFRVQGSGFGVKGSGFRVQGSGSCAGSRRVAASTLFWREPCRVPNRYRANKAH